MTIDDALPGTCRDCKRRRDVFSCSRRSGGNYRTPQQQRPSSICAECAVHHLSLATPEHGARGWRVGTLRAIAIHLDTDESRAALAAYDAKVAEKEHSRAEEEERMRPYRDRIAERTEIRDWVFAQQHVDGMDPATCRALGYGIKNGKAGNERTGWNRGVGGPWAWERTMREQVIDFIIDPANADLDATTRTALAEGVRDGLHRPLHKTKGS